MVQIDLKGNNLSQVSECLVVGALSKMEELMLIETEFGPGQLETLFINILNKRKTKSLNLYGTNLRAVDEKIFAETLRTIEQVVLFNSKMTDNQIVSLSKAMNKNQF